MHEGSAAKNILSVASALGCAALEKGVPVSLTFTELHECYGAPPPIQTGRLVRGMAGKTLGKMLEARELKLSRVGGKCRLERMAARAATT